MKSTGIVRKVDDLGRVVLPKELRTTLNISEQDSMEIFVDQEKIVLQKYEPACVFCGETEGVFKYQGKNICEKCAKDMAAAVKYFDQPKK